MSESPLSVPPIPTPKMPEPVKSKLSVIKAWIKAHPRKSAAIGSAIAIVLAGTGFFGWKFWPRKIAQVVQVVKKKEPPKPTTKASPLTGVQVAPELADRAVRAVIIENHPDARPQSGLSQAGVVYEALAEGGITRYQAFFGDEQPKEMGPVRSVRTYFVSWGLEFDAPVAHVGGNADALDLIGPLGMKDMNQFYHGGSFYRTTDRFAPHNVYTTTALMDQLVAALGYNQPAKFKPSPRKADQPPVAPATAAHPSLSVRYSYADFNVRFDYDAASNSYLRFLAGLPDKDRNTGLQIGVKNVVVEIMPTSYGTTRIGEATVMMQTVGSGRTIVLRDGGAVEGTWSKSSNGDRTRLLDAAGKDIPLDRGHTWYCIVPPTGSVTY